MQKVNLLLALLGLASMASAQFVTFGKCPKVYVKQDFQLQPYVGDWYEFKKYSGYYQLVAPCISAHYLITSDREMAVINRQYSRLLSKYNVMMGTARLLGEINVAKLGIKFPSTGGVELPYWVLDTDYTSYAVVFSCVEFGLFNAQFSRVLTRERMPSEATIQLADNVLHTNGLDRFTFRRTDQKNCPPISN